MMTNTPRSTAMLNRAGMEIIRVRTNLRIPRAALTTRSTRNTRKTRTTRSSVGDKMISVTVESVSIMKPVNWNKHSKLLDRIKNKRLMICNSFRPFKRSWPQSVNPPKEQWTWFFVCNRLYIFIQHFIISVRLWSSPSPNWVNRPTLENSLKQENFIIKTQQPLTSCWYDDDDEIKHVERITEVVIAHPDQLKDGLQSEDGRERDVDVLGHVLPFLCEILKLFRVFIQITKGKLRENTEGDILLSSSLLKTATI